MDLKTINTSIELSELTGINHQLILAHFWTLENKFTTNRNLIHCIPVLFENTKHNYLKDMTGTLILLILSKFEKLQYVNEISLNNDKAKK